MKDKLKIKFTNHRIFMELHQYGHSPHAGSFYLDENNHITAFFTNSRHDSEAGSRAYTTVSTDAGVTWSKPKPIGPIYEGDQTKHTVLMGCGLNRTTKDKTLVITGFHMQLEEDNKTKYGSLKKRPYTFIVGRKEKDKNDFEYTEYPSGTFSDEQFVEGGIMLDDGRLLFTIWGSKKWGENWRCGVLISDDDAKSFKYTTIGYEPDLNIRWNKEQPAGFNEQSLFVTESGKIISIIRGRHFLGAMKESPKDTYFFRSVSQDRGESWSQPVPISVPGTGAAAVGAVLSDGSLIHACRLPYHRTYYDLPDKELFGLHFVRSFDDGITWRSEHIIQQSPHGYDYINYYNTMNGQFITLNGKLIYTYGFRNHTQPDKCYIAAIDLV